MAGGDVERNGLTSQAVALDAKLDRDEISNPCGEKSSLRMPGLIEKCSGYK